MANDEKELIENSTIGVEKTPVELGDVEKKSNSNSKTINLKRRFDIDLSTRIDWLENNGARAYEAVDNIGKRQNIFALVCSSTTAPRTSLISQYREISHPNIMQLIDSGIILHPEDNVEHVVLVYEKPMGGRILSSKEEISYFHDNPSKVEKFLLNFTDAIDELHKKGIIHRSIRLDNFYYKDIEKTEIVLGDCLASFPAFYQPASYETMGSLMANPQARGNGTAKNDVYALGVSTLSLITGKKLLGDIIDNNESVFALKLSKGSYAALTEDDVMTGRIFNFIKKTLDDNPIARWSTSEVYDAIKNGNISKRIVKNHDIAKKPMTINEQKIYNSKDLAWQLYQNPSEAYELIKSHKLVEWIKNGLQDEEMSSKAEKIIKASISANDKPETTVIKAAILLAPNLPIKYKNITFFPDGIAKAAFYAIKNKIDDISIFRDIFSEDIIKSWYQEQKMLRSPINSSNIKLFINKSEYGYGIYRVIYEMDYDIPCFSELMNGKYINSQSRILQALDEYYQNKKDDELPIDKNLSAYIYSRIGRTIDKMINRINSKKQSENIAGTIKLYSVMQAKFGPAKLINLAKWLASASSPMIENYHNLRTRKKIQKEIIKTLPQGNISAIYNIIENDDMLKRDNVEYLKAINTISKSINDKLYIMNSGRNIIEEAEKIGKNLVSVIAMFIMIISFVYFIIQWVEK